MIQPFGFLIPWFRALGMMPPETRQRTITKTYVNEGCPICGNFTVIMVPGTLICDTCGARFR